MVWLCFLFVHFQSHPVHVMPWTQCTWCREPRVRWSTDNSLQFEIQLSIFLIYMHVHDPKSRGCRPKQGLCTTKVIWTIIIIDCIIVKVSIEFIQNLNHLWERMNDNYYIYPDALYINHFTDDHMIKSEEINSVIQLMKLIFQCTKQNLIYFYSSFLLLQTA